MSAILSFVLKLKILELKYKQCPYSNVGRLIFTYEDKKQGCGLGCRISQNITRILMRLPWLPFNKEEEIKDIEYLPAELVPDNPARKYSTVDVRCRDKQGRQFLVEIQMLWSPEFRQRVLFNAAKDYELLQPVYSLNLVNDVFEPALKGFYHHYKMVHTEHSDKVIEGLQLIFVELPKFNPQTFSEKKMQVLWLRFLTEINENTREVSDDLKSNPEINKALSVLEESAFSDAELYAYDRFWDGISTEITYHNSALRRGLAEGEAKGILESQRQIATNFKKQGVLPEIIAQCTGLSLDEIAIL